MEEKDKKAAEVDDDMAIRLKKPIDFEGERYDRIDLSGLQAIKTSDMIAINRRLTRTGNVDTSKEVSLEYAIHMANVATGLPLEFFEQLPPYAALAIRGRVMSFLFGWG